MSKISTYPSAETPLLLSDRLIGTEAIRTPPTSTPLATKNFSLGELLQLFSSNFPAASLQAVLNTGNTATQNITLIGTIDATLIKPVNIEDTSGSQGNTFQFLSKGASSINWVDLPISNLQAILDSGNTATQNINLIGDITATKVIPGNIQDENSAIGTTGQVLSKTATGIRWINNPIMLTPGLADVLSVGNTATNDIILNGYIKPTNIKDSSNSDGSLNQVLSIGAGGLEWKNETPSVVESLTVIGNSGPSTLISKVLNIPTYTLSGLGGQPLSANLTSLSGLTYASLGFVKMSASGIFTLDTSIYLTGITSSDVTTALGYTPVTNARTLTINGITYDLTADRSWTIATSPLTTKGDLYTFSTIDARLPVGANTQILSVDSAEPTGLKWINVPATGVTSVGLTMPSAFTVTNSPITSSGDIAVTGAGLVSQYIRGDGTLANFPASTGGGASLSFYLNGSVSQGTIGGVAFREMDRTPILGAGTDFTINANGYIQSFITDAGVPNLLEIPAGNWNFETYFSASSGGGSPSFYLELYKWDGTTLSLIASNSASPRLITDGTSIEAYFSVLAVPQTTLLATDRLAVRIYVNNSGRTITLHTEDNNLCQVITTFTTGLTALNGLTSQVQYFAVGTSGTDFNISSATDTHTFNLPTASATNRGALSTTDWTNFNTAYTDRLKWDGGATGLVAATGRTSLGATTVGDNLFTLTNPSAITFIRINADNSISTLNATDFRTAIGAGTVTGAGLTNQIAYFTANGSNIGGLDTFTYPSLTELAYVKGVTSSIQPQIDAVNVNVITITTSVSITTDTTSGSYGQHGRHVKISNGANAINIECVSTSNADFVASYEKLGTSNITFTAGAGITLITLSPTAILSGVAGSKACLSRTSGVYYLQITNY